MPKQNRYVGQMEHAELVNLTPTELVVVVRALVELMERWEHVKWLPLFVVLMVRARLVEIVHKLYLPKAYYCL